MATGITSLIPDFLDFQQIQMLFVHNWKLEIITQRISYVLIQGWSIYSHQFFNNFLLSNSTSKPLEFVTLDFQ